MRRIVIVAGLVLSILSAAVPVLADDPRGVGAASSPSVFPTQRDPWRSWGVREDRQRDFDRPHARRDFVRAEPVWVPGQWVWNGAAWVWWPGGWVR